MPSCLTGQGLLVAGSATLVQGLMRGPHALHAVDFFDDDATTASWTRRATRPRLRATRVAVWCSRVPAVPVVLAGRDILLESLGAWIAGGQGAVLTQTIQGMGEDGQDNRRRGARRGAAPPARRVWWVRAEQPAVLVADLAEMAPREDVPVDDDRAVTAGAVRDWLEPRPGGGQ